MYSGTAKQRYIIISTLNRDFFVPLKNIQMFNSCIAPIVNVHKMLVKFLFFLYAYFFLTNCTLQKYQPNEIAYQKCYRFVYTGALL